VTRKEFKQAFGYEPHQAIGKNAPAIKQKQAKKPQKRNTGNSNRVNKKSALEWQYEALSEDEHQEALIKWLDAKKIYFEASINGMWIPNPHPRHTTAWIKQNNINRKIVQKHKRLGFRKGVADIKVYLPEVELNIELKKIGGDPTKEQKEVSEKFKKFSYATYEIIEGYKEAIRYIEKFL